MSQLVIHNGVKLPLGLPSGSGEPLLAQNSSTGLLQTQTGSAGNPFSDAETLIKNSVDATKLAKFSAASITTGTTRTYTLPNSDGTLTLTSDVWKTIGTATLTGTTSITTGSNSLFIGSSNVGLHHKTAYLAGSYSLALWQPDASTQGIGIAVGSGDLDGTGDGSYSALFTNNSAREIALGVAVGAENIEFFIQGGTGGAGFVAIFDDFRTTKRGIEYGADYSPTLSNLSLIHKGFADTNYWKTNGTTTLTGNITVLSPSLYGIDFGDGIDDLTYFNVNTLTSGFFGSGGKGIVVNSTFNPRLNDPTLLTDDPLTIVSKGFADTNYWTTSGTTTISSNQTTNVVSNGSAVNQQITANQFAFGQAYIGVTDNLTSTTAYAVIHNGSSYFQALWDPTINNRRFTFNDGMGVKRGIEYAASGYVTTDRSLTDRGYVLGAKTFTGSQTFRAGTAAAGTAPLYLQAGTALTTPADGALEYHSSHLYFTIGSTRYQLDQQPLGILETADGNYGIGDLAVDAITTGDWNTGAGYQALTSVQTGNHNVAFGSNALQNLISGNENVAIGNSALYDAEGTGNVAIGYSALGSTTGVFSGNYNIAIGRAAGYANQITTGAQNVIIGYAANVPSLTASGQLSIQNAIYGASNTGSGVTDSTGTIGIYISAPTASLDIIGSTTAKASLRIRSGTAPTTPNSGDMWFDGTNLKFYDGTTTRTITWT